MTDKDIIAYRVEVRQVPGAKVVIATACRTFAEAVVWIGLYPYACEWKITALWAE